MKKYIMMACLVMVLFLVGAAIWLPGASKIRVELDHGMVLAGINPFPTGVRYTQAAEKYPDAVKSAFRNPGTVIMVVENRFVYDPPSYSSYHETVRTGVKYDPNSSMICVVSLSRDIETGERTE